MVSFYWSRALESRDNFVYRKCLVAYQYHVIISIILMYLSNPMYNTQYPYKSIMLLLWVQWTTQIHLHSDNIPVLIHGGMGTYFDKLYFYDERFYQCTLIYWENYRFINYCNLIACHIMWSGHPLIYHIWLNCVCSKPYSFQHLPAAFYCVYITTLINASDSKWLGRGHCRHIPSICGRFCCCVLLINIFTN